MARMLVSIGEGKYKDPVTGSVVDTSTTRDDMIIDSVGVGSGTLTVNTKRNFWQSNLSGVLSQAHFSTQLSGRNKLPEKTALLELKRVGFYVQQAIGNTTTTTDDVCKIVCNGHVYLYLDSRDVMYDGPAIALQSGIGVWGATGDTSSPIATTGVPSLGAAPEVHPKAQWSILSNNTLNGYVDWPNATWIDDANHGGASTFTAAVLSVAHAMTVMLRGPYATW